MRNVTVTVERSDHQHPGVPRGVVQLVEKELERRGIGGAFCLKWGPRLKGTPHTPRFYVVGSTDRGNIELEIKPGGNDTAHRCWLEDTKGGSASSLLTALTKEPTSGDSRVRFTDDASNIKGALVILGGLGGYNVPINELKEKLSESYPQMSTRGWGGALSALERRGLIALEKTPSNSIYSVSLDAKGRAQLNGHAPPPPIQAESVPEVALEERTPSTPGEWLHGWVEKEEKLLGELLEAEEEEKIAAGRVRALRAELELTSKRAAAARVLLGG